VITTVSAALSDEQDRSKKRGKSKIN